MVPFCVDTVKPRKFFRMTLSQKLIDSFKSTEFDIEYFVNEAAKSQNPELVLSRLDDSYKAIETDLRSAVKDASDIILSTATVSDQALGELLSVREHLSSARSVFEELVRSERNNLDRLREKNVQLRKAIDVSKLLKKISKLSIDVSKLRAHFPTESSLEPRNPEILNKACLLMGQVESIRGIGDYADMTDIELVREDLMWVEKLVKALRKAAIDKMKFVLTTSESARRDLVSLSKCIQVIFNLGILQEVSVHMTELLVEVYSQQYLDFLQKLPGLKQGSSVPSVQSDKALNQFWDMLDTALGNIPAVVGHVATLEAIICSATDPSSGTRFSVAWEKRSPAELSEFVWAFVAKALATRISLVTDANPKLKKAMASADYLRAGITKVSEEARQARKLAYEITGGRISISDSDKVVDPRVIVDRLRQTLR